MTTLDGNFILQIKTELTETFKCARERSNGACLSKINNKKAKKILSPVKSSNLIDVNSNKPNKRRAYDRHQIKVKLQKRLEKRNEAKIKNMFSSDADQEFLDKLLNN